MSWIPVNIKLVSTNNGWICPKCGRVYSPFIPECQHCNIEVKPINGTIICDGNKTGIINGKWVF